MPRYARAFCEKQVYHVMLRGNNKENIFIDNEDKSRIIDTINDKRGAGEYSIYAYCIMDNHPHLLVKEGKSSLPRIIKMIATSYAYYFNKKYRRIGHVFQDRYRSENIDNDKYLLTAIRYIHQNPLKACIGTIEGYKWSSYKEYIYMCKFVEIDEILNMFSTDNESARSEFARFNHENCDEIFLDIGKEKKINQHNVFEYIDKYIKHKGLEALENIRENANKSYRDELIRLLVEKSDISRRGIADIIGVNRETVRRLQDCQKNRPRDTQ